MTTFTDTYMEHLAAVTVVSLLITCITFTDCSVVLYCL